MSGAAPASVGNDLIGEINRWQLTAARFLDETDFTFRSNLRRAQAVYDNVSAYEGSMLKALVFAMSGNVEQSVYWLRNAIALSPNDELNSNESIVFTNLSLFREAFDADKKYGSYGDDAVAHALNAGCFREALEWRAGSQFAGTEVGADLLGHMEGWSVTMELTKVRQEQLEAVLALAGQIMRAHRLVFVGADSPIVRGSEEGLLYQIKVRVDSREAAKLTREVVEKMVERDLDSSGLSFAFVPA
jgi:hypothetical protein